MRLRLKHNAHFTQAVTGARLARECELLQREHYHLLCTGLAMQKEVLVVVVGLVDLDDELWVSALCLIGQRAQCRRRQEQRERLADERARLHAL